jgi:arylsulfatase A-like enzyme
LEELYDADTMPGVEPGTPRVSWGVREQDTLEAIRSRIRRHEKGDRRFFLTYVPAAPHYPYDCIPREFQKFKIVEIGDYTPLYLNELLYMDWVIASIIDQLRDSGLLDETLVVITNDHGEMLGEKGSLVGHGWAITPKLANSPLIIMDPRKPGYRTNERLGSQVDVLPTVLHRLGIPTPEGQLYQGRSLDSPQAEPRLIYVNSYQQYGIVTRGNITIGDRRNQRSAGPADSVRTSYRISNDGSRTLFEELDSAEPGIPSIAHFDAFQTSFLRYYTAYCKTAPRSGALASVSAHR